MRNKTKQKSWQLEVADQVLDIFKYIVNNPTPDDGISPVDSLSGIFTYLSSQVKTGGELNLNLGGVSVYYHISNYSNTMLGQILDPEEFIVLMNTIESLLIRKQKDYGPKNILEFGHIGLIVRMFDKVARLNNLTSKSKSLKDSVNKNSVPNESIVDTLIDLIGYSTIGLMLSTPDEEYGNKFSVPMDKDSWWTRH